MKREEGGGRTGGKEGKGRGGVKERGRSVAGLRAPLSSLRLSRL